MIHQKKRTERKLVVIIEREWYTCDICREEIKEGTFDIREGRVLLKTGSSYPDGSSVIETRADLCERCFNEKLIPWLESQGVQMQTKDSQLEKEKVTIKITECEHPVSTDFYESHSCTCGDAYTWRCASCGLYITEDPCGERSGKSGWSPARWRAHFEGQKALASLAFGPLVSIIGGDPSL